MNKKLIKLTESDLHGIVKESVEKILDEVSLKGKSGKEYSLHGNDAESWGIMANLRSKKMNSPKSEYNLNRDNDNFLAVDDEAHPNLRSRNNAKRIDAMFNRIENASDDIAAANDSYLRGVVKESIKSVLNERKPNDKEIRGRKFKGLRYDRNGNPIYTSDDIRTAEDIEMAKRNGWKMSRKHGLYGQINDTSSW